MREDFLSVLREHVARYPLMGPQDCAKLAYQSEFGPEHLAPDRASFLRALQNEWASALADGPPRPPEPIGNGLCRFHLSPAYPPPLAAPLLADLFLLTARDCAGTMDGLLDRLEQARLLDVPGMESWLPAYLRRGCPPLHHSQPYRDAYRPHYRLLKPAYAGYFPALLRVAELARDGRPAVVAVDGRCGSGKTALAALLQQLFPCRVFHMDDFYLPLEGRVPGWEECPGGNMDFARFLEEVLLPAKAGADVTYRPFRCRTGDLGDAVAAPARPLTIVEGSYAQHPSLSPHYDLKLFLTCSKEEQTRRLKAREGSCFPAFEARWIPMEERYIRRCAPVEGGALAVDTSRFWS